MQATFGDQLKLFALSVDLVGSDKFNHVSRLIDKYCQETLDIDFTKLHLASNVDGKPGLSRYRMGENELENIVPIRNVNGSYNGQTSISFDKSKPLWIVSSSGKQTLESCEQYYDQWSKLKSLPKYRTTEGQEIGGIRTSIIIPIPDADANVVLGVINFRTKEYIEPTDEAKNELLKIADAMGILIRLYRNTDGRKLRTHSALEQLNDFLSRPLPKLTKPKIFLASSAQANDDVIEEVKCVLNESAFADRLDLVYWKTMDQPGNINHQLLKAISKCRYGICYFSQRVGENEYVDNINVVFEAGMFHGRVDGVNAIPVSWIPIREHLSPELPFDFAQERILWVKRNKMGKLSRRSFSSSLRRTLDALLKNI